MLIGVVLALVWRRPWFLFLLVAVDLAAAGLSLVLRQWIGRVRPPLVYPEPPPLVPTPHTGSFHPPLGDRLRRDRDRGLPRLAVPAFVPRARRWSRVVEYALDVSAACSGCWSLKLF